MIQDWGDLLKLVVDRLSVTYALNRHKLLALDGVGLTLAPGQITAVVGESGSGKTTLAKAIVGVLPPYAQTTGSIKLDELEITGASEATLAEVRWASVAMLSQNGGASLNPVYRIIDQLAEPLIHHKKMKKRSAREAAEKVLMQMGLDPGLGYRFPHELSGGEIQRVLLGMVFILDPEVVVLDEPTAALDSVTKAFVSRVLLAARASGKAILLITHDLELARRVADAVVVLYLGQVMEVLPAPDLFRQPRHPYTLAFSRSFPSMETHRDLGGIRGDAFFRILHNHPKDESCAHTHTHVVGTATLPENGHSPARGCLFHPRCTQAVPECRVKSVALEKGAKHQVRCLRGGIATALRIEGVSKSYGAVTALAPLTLSLRCGEILCLVGESGSGKSTLALIAAGVLKPDQGRRIFEGRDMDQPTAAAHLSLTEGIGVVQQNPMQAVSHRLTVFDIVEEPLRIKKKSVSKEMVRHRVIAALQDVHLPTEPAFLTRYPHELNMGTVQRVCMARALVTKPRFLVADEPTSALDPSVQAKVLKMLLDLQTKKGLTMLFVTHDIGLARKVGDHIAVMQAGNLVETGPAAEVLNSPLHPYTEFLLQSAAGDTESHFHSCDQAVQNGCSFALACRYADSVCFSQASDVSTSAAGRHAATCVKAHRKRH